MSEYVESRVLTVQLGDNNVLQCWNDVFMLITETNIISIQGTDKIFEAVGAAQKFLNTMRGVQRLHDAIYNVMPEDHDKP